MPTSPPVTTGLNLWLCSDTHVSTDASSNRVTNWADAQSGAGSVSAAEGERPLLVPGIFGSVLAPVVRFDVVNQLMLVAGVDLSSSDFTLFAAGTAAAARSVGTSGVSSQKFLFGQTGDASSTFPSISVGNNMSLDPVTACVAKAVWWTVISAL